MIINASAVIAVIGKEPGHEQIIHDFPQTDLELASVGDGS